MLKNLIKTGFIYLDACEVLKLNGDIKKVDALLQGQVTSDISELPNKGAQVSCLLDQKGFIQADFILVRKENEVFVVYKYALRNDAPPTSTGSRDFCVRMTAQSRFKSWTFEDIERLNNGQGLDVFTSRGGFYNNPIFIILSGCFDENDQK